MTTQRPKRMRRVSCDECGRVVTRPARSENESGHLCDDCMGVLKCPLCGDDLISVGLHAQVFTSDELHYKCVKCGWRSDGASAKKEGRT